MAMQMKMTFAGLVPRTTKTAAVAQTSARSVKSCHGRSVDASLVG
jgi:hypothetical protein